jgi:hypothetical protein
MRTLNTFAMTLAGAAALLASACSSSKSPPASGEGGVVNGIPLVPTDTGFVTDATSGIIGAWYAYGDGAGPGANMAGTDFANSECAKGGFTADLCTQITAPTPGQPFPPTPGKGMCTSGVAAKVQMDTTGAPAYSALFGGGIGLDFNNPGGDAGVKMPIDLSGYKGFSFDFSGDMIPAGNKIRVNFPFVGEHATDSPYWAANVLDDHSTISTTSTNTVLWASVLGPAYLAGQTPKVVAPAFLPSMVESIQFQVFTNAATATPYAFCVNNLTLLTN